jgi:hypothetical protein
MASRPCSSGVFLVSFVLEGEQQANNLPGSDSDPDGSVGVGRGRAPLGEGFIKEMNEIIYVAG